MSMSPFMELMCISDLHGRVDVLERIKADAKKADLLIAAGDITNFGKRKTAEAMLEELRGINPNFLAVPGNCDTPEVNDVLNEQGVSLHGRGRTVDGIGFFGAGGSNITPFRTPQEYTEKRLVELLARGYDEIKALGKKVMVCHPPPCNTAIDVTRSGMHVGSMGVREFLEGFPVALGISGHVHEAKGRDTLGRATIINPGPAHMGYAKVEIGEGVKVKFIDF
jgi:hypothetical protein